MTATIRQNIWLPNPQPNEQAQVRLFCFHYAGGGASAFQGWAGRLPPSIAVHPVQMPGRETRLHETPFTHIAPLVSALAEALLPLLDRPFACFGHSMGALVSFELARELRRIHGLSPQHLFVSARRAPQMPDPEPPFFDLPDDAFLARVRRLNGTPEHVLGNPELMALLLPALRADFTLCDSYSYTPDAPLSCPVTAFCGLHDPLAGREDMLAWGEQTRAPFSVLMMPGDHFFLNSARPLLLWQIEQALRTPSLPRRV